MNLLISLRDQLPPLLMLSPLIGFLVTSAAVRAGRDLVRHLAFANAICTLLILSGLVWRFESELNAEMMERRLTGEDVSVAGTLESAQAMVHRRVDKQRAERLARHLFLIDGINLWPTFVFVVMVALAAGEPDFLVGNSTWSVPSLLFYEAAMIGALTAQDLRVYLLSYAVGAFALSLLLGQWGGFERRVIAGRFLVTQFCGISFVMLGIAMLAIAVPWMKIEDSPARPAITWNISTIIFEIQKWTTNNELAFHYQNEVFPWMLLILSLGFAIQFGLFPFQSTQIRILEDSPRGIAVVYLTGLLPACSVGWLRFVAPLAPDLLVGFDWLILVPSLGGAAWGVFRALSPIEPRRKAALIYSSVFAVSLLGFYTFTRFGTSGGWLMQQQITLTLCLQLLAIESTNSGTQFGSPLTRILRSVYSSRTLLLILCLSSLGLFASGFVIVFELSRDNLLLAMATLFVGACICETIYSFNSLMNHRASLGLRYAATTTNVARRKLEGTTNDENPLFPTPQCQFDEFREADHAWQKPAGNSCSIRFSRPLLVVLLLAFVANLCPNLMLRQCEPEFARVFRRFEHVPPAISAERDSAERQTSP